MIIYRDKKMLRKLLYTEPGVELFLCSLPLGFAVDNVAF